MAFKEYRNSKPNPETREFDIERFAYDIFAYMLPICGFPDTDIPTTSREENIYVEEDFVRNFGLSVLPIALFIRDEWKCLFEKKFRRNGFRCLLEIESFLESEIFHNPYLCNDDTLSIVLFSLALYNEFMLFYNCKGFEIYLDQLPKIWSQLCQQLIFESEDFETFESSFAVRSDVTEEFITKFMRMYAIPYGSTKNTAYYFSIYISYSHSQNNNDPEEMPKESSVNDPPDVVAQAINVSDVSSEPSLTEDCKTALPSSSGREDSLISSEQLHGKSGENALLETKELNKNANGLACMLQRYLKKRKRNTPPKLDFEDAFKEISLENENVSRENCDTKRRRKASDKDILE